MGFRHGMPHDQPYYLGAGSSSLIGTGIADVAIGGHVYMIDWSATTPLLHRSIPILKPPQDNSDSPGEQSVNPEGWWRRAGESWHEGAGQQVFDRKTSSAYRFRQSQGMYVWQDWSLSLLQDTDIKIISAQTNQKLAVAGGFLYYTDGATLRRTADISVDTPTFTTITGTPATQPSDITTDGFNIITCHGASGIYKTTRGAATTAAHITGTVTTLGFVKNRFIAANNNSLYDISALTVGGGGALPAAYFTHPNTDFVWVGFAEGDAAIYFAGFSGAKSLIYRAVIKADGTALDAPIIAGRLEEGEIVTSIYGYLGRFIFIGTNMGWHLAIPNDSGDLRIGSRIDTNTSVLCFEGENEFVWFGWGNFASSPSATGLGRLSLKTFTNTDLLTPAYASDLMVSGQTNNIRSIATFNGLRVLAVDQIGIFAEDSTKKVASGYIDTGEITYGITEHKVGISIDAQHTGELGTHEISISVDGGSFVSLGLHEAHLFPRAIGEPEGRFFELRHTLYRDSVDLNTGLTMHSWLLNSQVKPSSITQHIFCTVLLAPRIDSLVDTALIYDTADEVNFLTDLVQSKTLTTFQEGNRSYGVLVDDYELRVARLLTGTEGYPGMNTSCLLQMKVVN